MTYFLISWATALKLGLFVYFCMQSWMVTLILTYWPTFLLVELQLWNLDHWCTFACRIEWWPRFWPSDLLSYYFSYSLETWTVCVFLHVELNGDLDSDLVTYFLISWATALKFGHIANGTLIFLSHAVRKPELLKRRF